VQVALPLLAGGMAITMSSNTLMFRGEGMRVAVVDDAGLIKLRPVKIGRNYGDSVEVLEGVGPKDRVVLNPSDSLADGDKVEIAVAAPAAAKGQAPGASKGAPAEKEKK
jgi:multidrug efflux pump subunit AcrA (membrane-fusion protein)